MRYLLDTHTWIWWHMHPDRLSPRVLDLIRQPGPAGELLLSAISPWEFGKLLVKGRLTISCHPEEWMREALRLPRLRLVPLSPVLALRASNLPPPFHADPADQIIVATARQEDATLLTKDERILAYPHARSLW